MAADRRLPRSARPAAAPALTAATLLLLTVTTVAAQLTDYPDHDDYFGNGRQAIYSVQLDVHDCRALVASVQSDLTARSLSRHDEDACHVIGRRIACHRLGRCLGFSHCCLDSVPLEPPHPDMVCRRLNHGVGDVYMIERCPERWPDDAVRRMCAQHEEPFTALPVSSLVTNRTYSNYYCAVCHGDSQQSMFWTPRVRCKIELRPPPVRGALSRTEPFILTETFIWDNLMRGDYGQWGISEVHGNVTEFHKCELWFQPEGASTTPCSGVINCERDMRFAEIFVCPAYDELFTNGSDICTNEQCQLCKIDCRSLVPSIARAPPYVPPHSWTSVYVLDIMDRTGSGVVGGSDVCSKWQVRNPFPGRRCLDVRCDIAGSRLEGGQCVAPPTDNSTDIHPCNASRSSFALCPKHYLNASEYELADNGTVYVPLFERSFERDQYEVRDGELALCLLNQTEHLAKFDSVIAHIAAGCLAASVLCLLLHIAAFFAVAGNRNLPGMCVTSLSVCLLIGYLCLSLSATQQPCTPGCRRLAIVTFGALEASLFWTNIMAFDVFMTLRRASSQLHVARGRHLRRFAVYAAYVSVLTSAVMAAAVLADQSAAVPLQYRPGLGERLCWFSRRRPLMVFFAAPMVATMAANAALFVASAWLIQRMGSASSTNAGGQPRKYLRLYSRLALMMGLSWIVGLVAGWLDFRPLYYAFIILYTLQGVFICMAFTATRSARVWLRRQVANCGSVFSRIACRCCRSRPGADYSQSVQHQPNQLIQLGTVKDRRQTSHSSGTPRSTSQTSS